jgi:hypothetical protein
VVYNDSFSSVPPPQDSDQVDFKLLWSDLLQTSQVSVFADAMSEDGPLPLANPEYLLDSERTLPPSGRDPPFAPPDPVSIAADEGGNTNITINTPSSVKIPPPIVTPQDTPQECFVDDTPDEASDDVVVVVVVVGNYSSQSIPTDPNSESTIFWTPMGQSGSSSICIAPPTTNSKYSFSYGIRYYFLRPIFFLLWDSVLLP